MVHTYLIPIDIIMVKTVTTWLLSEQGLLPGRGFHPKLTQNHVSMFVSGPDPAKGRNRDEVVAEVDKHVDTLPATEVVGILLPASLQVPG